VLCTRVQAMHARCYAYYNSLFRPHSEVTDKALNLLMVLVSLNSLIALLSVIRVKK
jgi:hypothetical protein